MRLTISTDGEHRGAPVHDVEDIAAGSYYGGDYARHTAVVTLDAGQAMALASDLLYQLVDAGVLSGWNVQFPERDETKMYDCGGSCSLKCEHEPCARRS